MRKIVKVSELQLMDVFVFDDAEEYPCIYIGKTHYIEWSNIAHKVWDWSERCPYDKVTLIGKMESRIFPTPEESQSLMDEWAQHCLR